MIPFGLSITAGDATAFVAGGGRGGAPVGVAAFGGGGGAAFGGGGGAAFGGGGGADIYLLYLNSFYRIHYLFSNNTYRL
jgi:hypothetical protein